jgi:signal transduction histidine kinase
MKKSEEGNGSTFYFTLPYKYIITPLERVISKSSHR